MLHSLDTVKLGEPTVSLYITLDIGLVFPTLIYFIQILEQKSC